MSQEGKQKLPKLQVQHNFSLGILKTQVCIKIVKLLNQSNYRNKKIMTTNVNIGFDCLGILKTEYRIKLILRIVFVLYNLEN